MRFFLFSILCLGSISCKTNNKNASNLNDYGTPTRSVKGLVPEDFTKPLTREYIRSTNAVLNDEAFDTKWEQSRVNSLLFFRAFPAAYHGDLSQLPRSRLPGGEGLCLGDAHPDNFGFFHLEGKTIFAFNDLDDSGYCSIALDILRYLTAAQLNWKDPKLTQELLNHYVNTVKNPEKSVGIPDSFLPDWTALEAKELKKAVLDDAFISNAASTAPTDSESQAITDAMNKDKYLRSLKLVQAIAYNKESGGSGGLKRFRVLVDSPEGRRTILEFKQSGIPGSNFGKPATLLSYEERLDILKKSFWDSTLGQDYFYIQLNGIRFLVRDRLAIDSINLTKLDPDELRSVLLAQVSYLAKVHAQGWKDVKTEALHRWLDDSYPTLAERWGALYDKSGPTP